TNVPSPTMPTGRRSRPPNAYVRRLGSHSTAGASPGSVAGGSSAPAARFCRERSARTVAIHSGSERPRRRTKASSTSTAATTAAGTRTSGPSTHPARRTAAASSSSTIRCSRNEPGRPARTLSWRPPRGDACPADRASGAAAPRVRPRPRPGGRLPEAITAFPQFVHNAREIPQPARPHRAQAPYPLRKLLPTPGIVGARSDTGGRTRAIPAPGAGAGGTRAEHGERHAPMASRRDQLNAYTFAKRRLLAAFVQSFPQGSEEGAPRPLRGVVPGIVIGVIVMAVFGAWGMLKPTAPKGWDTPNEKVIIASESTTRYVVLKTGDEAQLHPVLNMASAKLLLAPGKGDVVTVSESLLDSGKIPHGATIGIPYAPDRLPSAKEAGAAKRWVVCERPSAGGQSLQKAALVLADREHKLTEGKQKLKGGELLYVVDPDGHRHIVDASGTAYRVDELDSGDKLELLLRTIVGSGSEPQRVSREWLATLHRGDPVTFPELDATPGTPADAPGRLDPSADNVGTVLKALDNNKEQYYVVLPGRVA